MPKNCYECPFFMRDSDTGIVACDICNEIIDISEIDKKRSDVCPMKGVKEEQKMTIYIKNLQKLKINNMDELEKFAEFTEKMILNKILTPDEVRDILGYEEKEEKSYTVTEFADHCRECWAKRHYELGKLDALNEIKEEIKNCIVHSPYFYTTSDCCKVRDDVMKIFDKHITKLEEDEE